MSRSIWVAAVLLGLSLSTSALAQEPSITAAIPFDFYVGNTHLQAGQYVIESPRPGLQLIRDKKTGASVASAATICLKASESRQEGTLVFNSYGDARFLAQVLWGGSAFGREIVKHSMESEFAKTTSHVGSTRVILSRSQR